MNHKIPVILDTDIGNDIDDTWALGMLLNSPEFDLKLLLTSTGDARYRAKVAARFLEACNRSDVPIGIGVSSADGSPESMHEYADPCRLEEYSGELYENGVDRALELIDAEPELTVIGIAPLTSLAELCRRSGRAVSRCRLCLMGGAIAKHHRGKDGAIAEYNIKLDVPAARQTFRAPWREIRLTPLDHCGDIVLSGRNYRKITETSSPIVRNILLQYAVWRNYWRHDGPVCASSILYDTAAVHLAYSDEFTRMERLKLVVDDCGFTRISPEGREISVAMEMTEPAAFQQRLVERLVTDNSTQRMEYESPENSKWKGAGHEKHCTQRFYSY